MRQFYRIAAAIGVMAIVPVAVFAQVGDPAPTAPVTENGLPACTDGADNDGDGFVDCADQDCLIYAVCVVPPPPDLPPPPPSVPPPPLSTPVANVPVPAEVDSQCRDGRDNDHNGLIDCHEPRCQSTRYCRRTMYERPAPPGKPQGFVITPATGLAMPNYNWKDVRVDSTHGENIPFDPDMGWTFGVKMLAVPLRWLGVGLNLRGGFTYASNRQEFLSIADDESRYKYDAIKGFGHVGGIIRLQVPVRRVVPYVDLGFGYSLARYHWYVYDGNYTWDIIGGWYDNDPYKVHPTADEVYKQDGHFTFALEPGVDVFIIERRIALGTSLWLPVVASEWSGMDNIGVFFNVTFTPAWAEPMQLKSEYAGQ